MPIKILLSTRGWKHKGLYTTLIDEEDEILAQYNWSVKVGKKDKTQYASRRVQVDGKEVGLWLHRAVFERMTGTILTSKDLIDHIDGNGLNNQRYNLRWADSTGNRANSVVRSDNESGFKGASFHKASGRWQAQIEKDGKNHYLGLYDTPLLAHLAYCDAAGIVFEDYANTGKGENGKRT